MQSHDRITLRFLAAPSDAVADGTTVQAGSVLEWIDKAGYACAVGWAASTCVTAYVGNVNFDRPIRPGELVEAKARVIHTGRTSIHVNVTISSADARHAVFELATHCILIFVSVDADGRPQEVPKWTPHDLRDLEFSAGAEGRVAARARIHEEMRAQAYTEAGTAPKLTLRFLAAPSAVNFGGNAHGGTVMRWIDDAARTCAAMWSKRESVAAYSGGIHFYRPVHIGDLVEVEARLIHTGSRSMHIAIHVRSGDPTTGRLEATTQCMSILVAKGQDGKALPIAPFKPESQEDINLDNHALHLVEMRAALTFLPVDFTV
ncbi:MAG: putative acyl-CoA thioester hydrolase [Glaciihabitans sp.]|nr:putative acyl-CoA thioester hydrolase [Glaciihabitans sp.]